VSPPQAAAAPPVPTPLASPAPALDLPQVELPQDWAELHEGAEPASPPQVAAPAGPPREAPSPGLRAVPPLSTDPEPVGPFTVVPPPAAAEQVDDGPEPSSDH